MTRHLNKVPSVLHQRTDKMEAIGKDKFLDVSRCLKVSPPLRSSGVSNVVELCSMRTVRELLSPVEMKFAKFSRHCAREMAKTGMLSFFSKVLLPSIVLIDSRLIREAW